MSHRAFDGYTAPQTANGVDGYHTTIRAQSANGTNAKGGDLILTSGVGTNRDGYVRLQAGNQDILVITENGFTATGAFDVTGNLDIGGNLNVDGSQITFDGYVTAPFIKQLSMPVPGADGYHLTIKAQNSTVNPAHGGDLILQSGDGYNGDGYFRDGYIKLYSGITESARIIPNRFYLLAGQRINLADVGTTPFNVPDGYFTMLVDTSIAITINLPANPARGDIYQVKDKTGTASTNNITVSGNGRNIDGSANYTISSNYGTVLFTYNGNTWSVL